MSPRKIPGFPRERIEWNPTIRYDACTGDRRCFDFCANGVFIWDEVRQRPIVANPLLCALGCNACAKQCAADAISFPPFRQLREQLHELKIEGLLDCPSR